MLLCGLSLGMCCNVRFEAKEPSFLTAADLRTFCVQYGGWFPPSLVHQLASGMWLLVALDTCDCCFLSCSCSGWRGLLLMSTFVGLDALPLSKYSHCVPKQCMGVVKSDIFGIRVVSLVLCFMRTMIWPPSAPPDGELFNHVCICDLCRCRRPQPSWVPSAHELRRMWFNRPWHDRPYPSICIYNSNVRIIPPLK